MRTGRSNGSTAYSYVYNGSQLVYMTVDGNTLYIVYDALGVPSILTYNGTMYFYITNAQGDIVAIADRNHNLVVKYEYDVWGNILSTTGSMASTLGVHNPLRYRGYVYDTETGLYYLQSRYYNPYIGRFINADAYAATGQGFIGNNMFAYCLNNPVNSADSEGTVADNYFGWAGEQIGIFLYEWITGDDHPQKQVQVLENQMIEKQTEVVTNGVKALGDAYMRSYNLQLEAQYRNSVAIIEGFNYLCREPQHAINLIGVEIGMSTAVYKISILLVAGNPTVGTVAGAVLAIVWAGWGMYCEIEGVVSDFLP